MDNIAKTNKVLEKIKNKSDGRSKCSYGDICYGDYGDHSGGDQDEDVYGDASYGDYGDHSG